MAVHFADNIFKRIFLKEKVRFENHVELMPYLHIRIYTLFLILQFEYVTHCRYFLDFTPRVL